MYCKKRIKLSEIIPPSIIRGGKSLIIYCAMTFLPPCPSGSKLEIEVGKPRTDKRLIPIPRDQLFQRDFNQAGQPFQI